MKQSKFAYLEYLHLVIILWNYPSFLKWNEIQSVYLVSACISCVLNVFYISRMNIFIEQENVLENYEHVLISHVYKTIGNSVYSYVSMVSVYLTTHSEIDSGLLLVCLILHMFMMYIYYFGDLQNAHALLVKNMPHIIDMVVVISSIRDIQLQILIALINIVRMYFHNTRLTQLMALLETYIICEIIT